MSQSQVKIDLNDILRRNGYRATFPRRAILETVAALPGHPGAKEIYLQINRQYPDIGLTTVYRTVDLLVKLGLLNRFDFGDGLSRYELVSSFKEHHHHLVCLKCGNITNYNDFLTEEKAFLEKLEKILSKKFNFDITGHEIQFLGTCEKCR
jgi:Fur family ferric uptake transcriptional regulator